MLVGDAIVVDDAIDGEAVGVGEAAASREASKAQTSLSENFIVQILVAGVYKVRTSMCA